MPDRVPNAPFREEFLRNEDLTVREVCEAVGWTYKGKARNGSVCIKSDTSRLKRALGLYEVDGKRPDTMAYDDAVKLLDVFGFDPVDVGV